ncbi:MAG TPA: DNA primase, partial [Gemmatimonadales bacterium]|nr:DNA primase [Gemmatimonadales bacterium]
MSRIPDEIIEQVRDAADLVEIVSESVTLKRTGADYRGPCPFHGGKGRNFAVIPKKSLYYCFVCHEGGDVFTWYMKKVGMDYPSAVREVARKVGVVIPETTQRAGPDPLEPLFGAVAVAQEFFARQLREAKEGEAAREYLTSRQVTDEQAGEWGLGFAPRGTAFLTEMRKLGLADELLIESGLAQRREDGTVGSRFRGRVLFPIHNLRGRVVGFGGRILGPGEPKYLNSPDSPVFHKGTLLYHLHLAKGAIRKEESVIVVEGYFDVLRLALAGIENVVAPLGTALTPDQAATLRRFARGAILLYDSDRAGLRATFRNGDELLRHGLRVRVASLPPGEDPDTLVQQGGAAALEPFLRDAMDVLERKLLLLEQRGWFEDVAKRRDALDRILPTLRAAADPMIRDLYIGRVSERVGISRETLEREVRERPDRRVDGKAGGDSDPAATPTRESPAHTPSRSHALPFGARAEEKLLRILIASSAWRTRAISELKSEDFELPAFRAIYEALVALPEGGAPDAVAPTLPDL